MQGCASTCKDAHWRAVVTECAAVVKNNELGKYLLLRKEVHEMMYSETIVKQHLRQGPMFVSRSIPFLVCDIDIPSYMIDILSGWVEKILEGYSPTRCHV